MQNAKEVMESGSYKLALNRSYYAIFHAIRAALALKSVDSSKHSGVISEFRKIYIKSGSIPAEVSQMIGAAFTIRNASDYDDMFIASKDETKEQIENAKYVYEQISVYIGKQLD